MPPPDEEVSGGQPAKNSGRSISATYAELVSRPRPSEVVDAMKAAVEQDDDELNGGPPIRRDDDTTIDVGTESIAPGALPSEVVDVTDLLDEVNARVEADEPTEENPEGKEYTIPVDNTGISAQFRAAGGAPSDAPPPPVETNTTSSLLDLKRREVQGRIKTDFNFEAQAVGDMPIAMLHKVEGIIFDNTWPNDDTSRRILRILLVELDSEEYDKPEVLAGDLDALKTAFRAELDKRRIKKPGEASPGSKKRRGGPPPLPR